MSSQAQQPRLEEVLVTAQKRVQSLQDVPVSVNVVSGDFIQNQNITDLQSLSATTPSFTVAEAGSNTNIFIRGIGSGSNSGFEQSVATFIDGLYYGRASQSRAQFLDIERVEVLRGPQGIIFGNSAIAGALNIVTRSPGDNFEGYVAALYEDEYETSELEAAVSTPITDTVSARFAVRIAETDGYLENTFTGDSEVAEESNSARATLQWTPTDTFDLNYKFTYSDYEVQGEPLEPVDCPPPGGQEPGLGCSAILATGFEASKINYEKSAGGEPPPWNPDTPAYFADQFEDLKATSHALALRFDVGEHRLSSLTGYVESENTDNIDVDQSPLGLVTVPRSEEYDQWSQELRLESPADRKFEYVVGAYYQELDVELETGAVFNIQPIPGGPAIAAGNFTEVAQKTTSKAVFGRGTFNFRDNLRASLGVRWSDIEKKVDAETNVLALDQVSDADPFSAFALKSKFGITDGMQSETRSWDDTTVDFVVQWEPTDELMLYARYAEGFKAGGYNTNYSYTDDPNMGFFEPEYVDAYELGVKSRLFDGRVILNTAIFRSEYEDLQVSALDGVLFVTTNAASSTSQGIEVDFSWLIAEAWRLDAAVALLDAEYDSYEGAGCTIAQTTAVAPETCTQDLSGRTLLFAPDYSGRVSLNYSPEVFTSYLLDIHVGVNFTDSYFSAQNLDPNVEHASYEKVDARIAFQPLDGGWELALIGSNLTDETTAATQGDLPLSEFSYVTTPAAPRTIAFQARYFW